ncbi:MAG: hypothetical protein V1860_03125 [bacterium]
MSVKISPAFLLYPRGQPGGEKNMTLEHNSKHKNILLIIFGLLILAGIIYFTWHKKANAPEQVFCTHDVKLCPDGSYVGRIPPDCEFAECLTQ